MMSANPLSWSDERQQSLHEDLQGRFASDAWRVGPPHQPERQSSLDFSPLQSNALKIELKYAVWCKFQRDDKHEWYLKFYQMKLKHEHVIPLVNETVVAVIQAQQEDTRAQWGDKSPYLFTRPLKRARGQPLPFLQVTFTNRLNRWALEKKHPRSSWSLVPAAIPSVSAHGGHASHQ